MFFLIFAIVKRGITFEEGNFYKNKNQKIH